MIKTPQFSRIENQVKLISDQINELYSKLNLLQKMTEVTNTGIPSHIERDLSVCINLLRSVNDTSDVIKKCLYE